MSDTERMSRVMAVQVLKQSRLLSAFNGLGESPDLQEFLDL